MASGLDWQGQMLSWPRPGLGGSLGLRPVRAGAVVALDPDWAGVASTVAPGLDRAEVMKDRVGVSVLA